MTTKQSEPTKEALNAAAFINQLNEDDCRWRTEAAQIIDNCTDLPRLLEIEKAAREFIGMWDYLRGAVPLKAEVVHRLRSLLEVKK